MAAVRILFTVEVVVYALLSFADLILTTVLLRFGGGGVYEGNPIARSWLEAFGWRGLIAFKLVSSSLVAFVSLVIYYYRPRLGTAIIALGCLVMGIVVAHSSNLLDKISKEAVAGEEARSSSKCLRLAQEILPMHRARYHHFPAGGSQVRNQVQDRNVRRELAV
jgi:Domain of unknown function (DUF5658)